MPLKDHCSLTPYIPQSNTCSNAVHLPEDTYTGESGGIKQPIDCNIDLPSEFDCAEPEEEIEDVDFEVVEDNEPDSGYLIETPRCRACKSLLLTMEEVANETCDACVLRYF